MSTLSMTWSESRFAAFGIMRASLHLLRDRVEHQDGGEDAAQNQSEKP